MIAIFNNTVFRHFESALRQAFVPAFNTLKNKEKLMIDPPHQILINAIVMLSVTSLIISLISVGALLFLCIYIWIYWFLCVYYTYRKWLLCGYSEILFVLYFIFIVFAELILSRYIHINILQIKA